VGEQRGGPPLVVVQVQFPDGEAPPLGNAWLAPRGSPPCRSGVEASAMMPDLLFGRPGLRELQFRQDQAERAGLMLAVPTVLDVDVLPGSLAGARRCLRLPVAEAEPRPEWTAPASFFLGAGVQTARPLGGAYADVGAGVLVDIYGGVWLGPARLRLDWLFGESSSPRAPPAGYDSLTAQLIGGALSVELFPVRAGRFGLGFNAGYEWLFTDFHAERGSAEWDEYHYAGPRGPRAMLRLGLVPAPPRWPGFSNQRDGWVLGVDLIAARWSGLGEPSRTVLGLGISADTGYWW
jgi:hypothetical protein